MWVTCMTAVPCEYIYDGCAMWVIHISSAMWVTLITAVPCGYTYDSCVMWVIHITIMPWVVLMAAVACLLDRCAMWVIHMTVMPWDTRNICAMRVTLTTAIPHELDSCAMWVINDSCGIWNTDMTAIPRVCHLSYTIVPGEVRIWHLCHMSYTNDTFSVAGILVQEYYLHLIDTTNITPSPHTCKCRLTSTCHRY